MTPSEKVQKKESRVLHPMMARSTLMDGRGYARALGALYQNMYAACRKRAEGKRRG